MFEEIENFNQIEVRTVTEFTRDIRRLIEDKFPEVWVRGEISNFVRAASGHIYFSLKDDHSQVRCAFFRSKAQAVDFELTDGVEVEINAAPTIYEKRGDFQLVVTEMRKAGIGRLWELFEKLRKKLSAEGLFDESRKRSIPKHPAAIGLVTSPAGAAIQDVLRTLRDKAPHVKVVVYPSLVQGRGAGTQLANAVRVANARQEVEVLLVCRGGGSFEDLWEFNSEDLVRSVSECSIPVVSGVGHESDFTLVDFVSDLRCATPTAAASSAIYGYEDLGRRLINVARTISKSMTFTLNRMYQRLDFSSRNLLHPARRLNQKSERLSIFLQDLRRLMLQRLKFARIELKSLTRSMASIELPRVTKKDHLDRLSSRIHESIADKLKKNKSDVLAFETSLRHLDPRSVMKRGFSIVRDKKGRIIRDRVGLNKGDQLDVMLSNGTIGVKVDSID
jgi:exodeoxyribonuclease VII large subunit